MKFMKINNKREDVINLDFLVRVRSRANEYTKSPEILFSMAHDPQYSVEEFSNWTDLDERFKEIRSLLQGENT